MKAAVLATRSIKKDAKLQVLDMAVAMVDLTATAEAIWAAHGFHGRSRGN
jgi:hypothetical protein